MAVNVHRNTRLILAVWLWLSAAVAPGTAAAFEIHGTVINGTTGAPVGPIDIRVVDPRHGMATEEEIKSRADGAFVVENLKENMSIYLLQVDYGGVTYTEMVRPEGRGHIDLQINVYDTTPDWDQVRVTIPHLMMRRTADTLSVDRMFTVFNNTDPPRTITGDNADFKLYLPEDRLKVTSMFVTSLGVPISVHPHPTDTPGVYTISYPFKPGETRVGTSFDLAYPETRYTYKEPLLYDIDDLVILAEDTTMTITSSTLSLGDKEKLRGFDAYHVASLDQGTVLEFTVSGGLPGGALPRDRGQQTRSSGPRVVILESPVMNASVIIITGFVLLLVLVTVFAAKSPGEAAPADTILATRRDGLLDQMAKLDDLFETGTVSDQLYRLKRGELMDALAKVIFQIDRTERTKTPSKTKKKGASNAR
ncbi:MAG: hypothetical protein JSW50_05060 [Candidatus Latescibacterota bacterium]|nr:MAG: hypothetical protein JSW50_05060 [Candidatus Latescibacterota bacterium]